MTDWKQKIEAQIAHMNDPHGRYSMKDRFDDAATMQALLDVAVAAEGVVRWYDGDGDIRDMDAMSFALDKLREVSGDE